VDSGIAAVVAARESPPNLVLVDDQNEHGRSL
jgi:hypothetical protein